MRDKTNTFLRIIIVLLLGIIAALGSYIYFNPVEEVRMPDLSTLSLTEAQNWAKENNLYFEYTQEFSDSVETDQLLSQDPEAGKMVRKGSTIHGVYSKGKELSDTVRLIDFTGMSLSEVEAWALENQLNDVSYDFEYHDTIPENIFIRHNKETEEISREELIVFIFSIGSSQENKDSVVLPDFSEYSRNEVTRWVKANSLRLKIIEEINEDKEKGEFIGQYPPAGYTVNKDDEITITYSLGPSIEAIDLKGKTKTEVILWQESYDNRFDIRYTEIYHNSIRKNCVVENSPNKGILADGSTVSVTLSLGKPNLTDYSGKDLADLKKAVDKLNEYGANLTLNLSYQNHNSVAKDRIISQSVKGEINTGTVIVVVVSKGKKINLGNYSGKNKSQLLEFCSDNDLNATLSKSVYDNSVAKDCIISHDPHDTEVEEGSKVTYILSLGRPTIADMTGKTVSQLESAVKKLNESQAQIVIVKTGVDSETAEKNEILSQSVSGEIDCGTSIQITYCRRQIVTVGDYVGKIRNGDLTPLLSPYLTYTFKEGGHHENKKSGEIIAQSVSAGSQVERGSTVTLTYSLGPAQKGELPDFAAIYSNGDTASATIKSKIESYLNNAGFTNYSVTIGDFGGTQNTIFEFTPGDGEYALDTRIVIKIQS